MNGEMAYRHSFSGKGRVIEMQHNGEDIRIPVLYPPRFGHILVRLFLDAQEELWRSIHVHQNASDPFVLPCWNSAVCPVCRRLREFDGSWYDSFKYRRMEIGIAYAWLCQYHGKMPHVRNCLNSVVILYGYSKFLNELSRAILQLLNNKSCHNFFGPQEWFRPLRIKFLSEKNDFEILLHKGNKEPPFVVPDKLPPLSQLIFVENQKPDSRKTEQYLKRMEAAHSRWLLEKSQRLISTRPEQSTP